jgi:hypothetical protein
MAESLANLRRTFWLANTTGTDESWSNADLERQYLVEQLGLTSEVPLSNADLETQLRSAVVGP